MVTPELVSYIKGEFAKGKTREMIRATLISEGGWSEVDLNDAFRTAIPMQGSIISPNPVQFTQNNPMQNTPAQSGSMYNNNPVKINPTQSSPIQSSSVYSSFQSSDIVKSASSSSKSKKALLIIIIVAVISTALWYFYRAQVMSSLNYLGSLANSVITPPATDNTIVVPEDTTPAVDNTIVAPEVSLPVAVVVKDCGMSASPDLKNSKTYKNNTVLNCLGNSALVCEDAKAVLTNALFPGVMQIVKDQNTNTCNFRLSYADDSTLLDANGNNLAGQYISCPLSIVKMVDETKPSAPVYKAPTLTDINKYASQIYFYGTIGVFMENNVDISKIQSAGCTGPYIDSVVSSVQKTQ